MIARHHHRIKKFPADTPQFHDQNASSSPTPLANVFFFTNNNTKTNTCVFTTSTTFNYYSESHLQSLFSSSSSTFAANCVYSLKRLFFFANF
jgi:hypothetical protein